jgi:succinoglycan biosynthesis transport protein ExoP
MALALNNIRGIAMVFDSSAHDDARIDVAALLGAIVRRLPRILLVTLALLVAGFIVLMFQPRLYESAAAILVEPRASVYLRASNEQAQSSQGNAAGVVSSQIELLKSRDTLLTVIDALDLRSVPEFNGGGGGFSPLGMISQLIGRRAATPNSIDETVLGTLYDRLTVVQERDSAIISVLVRSTDPQLAADIANAVANAHVARRVDLSISDTAEASGWLLDEINRLRVSVQAAESTVADFKVANDLFVGQNNTSLLDQQLSTIASQITTAQERKNTALSRASLIRGLIERGQSIEGVADVRNSLAIQQLSQEKARLQGELAQRSATLLASHPTIRALNAQVGELDNQIRQEGQRVAAALESEAQIEADLENSLQADLDRAKASASTATRDNVTLDGLEREAKAQRDLLESYLLRYNEASSRVDANSALPDVRVVSVAAPSVTPASPKTSLIMVAIGIVSVAVQVGAIAFSELMSGRALAPVARVPAARRQDELDEMPFDEAELEPEQRPEPVQEIAQPGLDAEPAPEVILAQPEFEQDEVQVHADFESVVEPVEAQAVEMDVVEVEPADGLSAPITAPDNTSTFIQALLADAMSKKPSAEAEQPTDTPESEAAIEMPAEPVPAASAHDRATALLRYSDLVSDLVLGRTHLLLLADQGDTQPSRQMAEDLIGDALAKGLSVALIDAGTGNRTENAGITDLSDGQASFGDVVQKSADNSFAEVSWGQGEAIARNSNRPLVLTEALTDIYEVVVVLTGQVDRKSMLGAFSELGGRIILVAGGEDDADLAESTRLRLEEAGLPRVEIAALAEQVAA